jgi:hypothetical protein
MAGKTSEQPETHPPANEGLSPLLEALVAQAATSARRKRRASRGSREVRPGEVIVGTLIGLTDQGEPAVAHPLMSREAAQPARSTVPLTPDQVGKPVALGFENGDVSRPIILGIIWGRQEQSPKSLTVQPDGAAASRPVQVEADGERIMVSARQEIVLQCGKASITLTPAGAILLRGTYLLSRSSGVNRIQGGSVQLN